MTQASEDEASAEEESWFALKAGGAEGAELRLAGGGYGGWRRQKRNGKGRFGLLGGKQKSS